MQFVPALSTFDVTISQQHPYSENLHPLGLEPGGARTKHDDVKIGIDLDDCRELP